MLLPGLLVQLISTFLMIPLKHIGPWAGSQPISSGIKPLPRTLLGLPFMIY